MEKAVKITIGRRVVSGDGHCFIIAEAGVNHNGDVGLAKKLVDAAKAAGADAIKFQTFKAEDLVGKNTEMADYQKKNTGKKGSQLKMLKKLELDYKDFIRLKKYCDKKKIIFLSTPHTEDAADFLEPLVSAYKIASGDLINLPFLEKVAKKKKPIILSTGMATLNEVREAVKAIKNQGNNTIILLHCTTNYPCPLEGVNLRAMLTLKKELGLPVGYSDHTSGIIVSTIAAAIGAVVIEKHFTLNKNLPGPDHKASIEPDELKEMVEAIKNTEKIIGSGEKKPTDSEKKIMQVVRKSIVAKIDISKGTKITKNMLVIKRPGIGIKPKYLNKIIGRRAKRNIKKDELITWNIV